MQTGNILVFEKSESKDAEIKVKSGSEFEIKIPGNPTTGYSWILTNDEELKSAGLEASNLDEIKTAADFVEASHQPGMVGVGGTFDFKFKLSEGKKNVPDIIFAYKRPWKKNNKDADIIKVKVVIE